MSENPTAGRPDSQATADGQEELAGLQHAFASHIRDPEGHPSPGGIEGRRMAIYRRLFFNNISSLLSGNFPVLRSLYDEACWHRLVRDFYSEHRCRTPLFPEVAREFLRYLQDRRGRRDGDPPFLLELAHYEWVELALSLDERELDETAADPGGDLLSGRPVLSPLAWPLSYRFPVHRISPECQPAEAPSDATHLLVYRDRRDDVRFMLLNDVTRLLLQNLQDFPQRSGADQLHAVATAICHPDSRRVIEAGRGVLQDFRRRDIVLGTSPS